MPKTFPTRPPARFLSEWFIFSAALAVIAFVIGLFIYRDYTDIQARERDRLAAQARVLGKNLYRTLDAVNRALASIRADLPRWQAERDGMLRASQRLNAFANAMSSVRSFLVLDARGQAIASNRPELVGQNFAHRDYFRRPQTQPDPDMLYVSPPFQTVLGVWSITLTRAILDEHGQLAGIISATLDPEELREQFAAVLYAPDMWAALIHSDGRQLLIEPDRPGESGRDLSAADSFLSRHRAGGQPRSLLEAPGDAGGPERLIALETILPGEQKMDRTLVLALSRDRFAIFGSLRREVGMSLLLVSLILGLGLPALRVSQKRREGLIQERKAAQAALAEQERFLRSLIDVIPGMVGYWDARMRCGFANVAYREWFGRTPEEMRQISIQELLGDELFRRNEPYIRAALAGEPQHFERMLTKPDGSTGYTWAHYLPDVVAGQVRGFFVLVSDVTEVKQAQIRLEAANEALERRNAEVEAANQAKSSFLATMSHEIRTPMNAIIGMTQVVLEGKLEPAQRDYLQKVHRAAQTLLRILNDTLDYAKLEAGQMTIEAAPFPLIEAIRDVASLFEPPCQQKGLDWQLVVAPEVPEHVVGDALRLEQVLMNLLSNAIKFTERGSVRLEVRALPPDERGQPIEFSVCDTGIGLEAAQLPQLFHPFFQADHSISRRFGGTGLGLSIVRQLVERQGGRITVDSQPGQGSCFRVTLYLAVYGQPPKNRENAPPPETAAPPEPELPPLSASQQAELAAGLGELIRQLAANRMSCRGLLPPLETRLAAMGYREAFRPVAEATRELRFRDAEAALSEFRARYSPDMENHGS